MNKLIITQDTSRTEQSVPNSVIVTLYNIGKDDDLNLSLTEGVDTTNNARPVSTVSGSIRVSAAYLNQLLYIATKYPNLNITVDSEYIYFEDPEVERVLLAAGIGDGIGISTADAATANLGTIFKNNTDITSFNEFKYFTKANKNQTNEMFYGCTSLASIDLSEIEKVSKSLFGKTAITDINAPNLTLIEGNAAFANSLVLAVTSLGHITTIKDSTFRDCEYLETVNLPDECTIMEAWSFGMGLDYWLYGGSLQTVNGINHITSFSWNCFIRQKNLLLGANDLVGAVTIGEGAFWYVPISVINCPNLISLGTSAFREDKALTSIECLGKVSSIPANCFDTCSNTLTIKLPYECTSIGSGAFYGNNHLTSVTLYNKSIDDYTEGETPTFTNFSKITSFGLNCFNGCSSLVLSTTDLSGAVTIGNGAFRSVKIPTINCPNLATLGGSAFYGNTLLTSVECLGKINALSGATFRDCSNLQTVKLPYECTTLNGLEFLNCSSLTTIVLYNKSLDDYAEGETPTFTDLSRITSILNECFMNCTSLQFDIATLSNVTNLGDKNTFSNTKVYGHLNMPNVQKFPENAFNNTNISLITISQNTTIIKPAAFGRTNITSITLPSSIVECGSNFVKDTAVPEIIYPEGCTTITSGQFSTLNNALTYIEIPSTITNMEHFFHRSLEDSLDNLCTVVIKATIPPTLTYYRDTEANDTKGNKFSGIYVPDASLTAYQNGANAWQHSSILAKLKPISQLQTDNPTAWARYNRTT